MAFAVAKAAPKIEIKTSKKTNLGVSVRVPITPFVFGRREHQSNTKLDPFMTDNEQITPVCFV